MPTMKIAARILSTLLLTAVLGGCFGAAPDDGSGRVDFFVKDAPADDFDSIFVTFSSVEVHRSAGDDEEDDAEDDDTESPATSPTTTNPTSPTTTSPTTETTETEPTDDEEDGDAAGWVELVNTTQTVDLKQFQGDAKAFLGSAEIAAGKYTQIRIHVDDAWGEKGDNVTNITVPSKTLKIVRPWNVTDGGTTVLVVDFDLNRSLTKSGPGGDYRLRPVMRLEVDEKSDAEDDDAAATSTTVGNRGRRPTDKGKP